MARQMPRFTYTGQHRTEMRGDTWYIYLLTDGTLTMRDTHTVDMFLVGGGGKGSNAILSVDPQYAGGGGGGGYTKTIRSYGLGNAPIPVTIGQGGNGSATRGGTTSILNFSAEGGYDGYSRNGGSGGGAGGAVTNASSKSSAEKNDIAHGIGGAGAGDGGNGETTPYSPGGYGQGFTTRAFGEPDGELYAGGGGGGGGRCQYKSDGTTKYIRKNGGAGGAGGGGAGAMVDATAQAGQPNTGGGGGGGAGRTTSPYFLGANGGSGIVIIRGKTDDRLPVNFNGQWVRKIIANGIELLGLELDGVRVFIRRMKECFGRKDAISA